MNFYLKEQAQKNILASFSLSFADPESRKQSSVEEHRNQVLLPELLGSSTIYE